MNKSQNYTLLGKVEKELRFLTKSEIRLEILKCLKESSYTVKEIVEKTGLRYSSVSSNMNKLEQNNNIFKKDNKFRMDCLTEIYLDNILDFNQSLEVITNFDEFWNKHNIDNLNQDSVKNLTDIYNCELVKSTSIDIYKTYTTIKSQIEDSKNILAIFPYLHPDYSKLIENELKKGAKIELIVNDAIYKSLVFNIDEETRRKSVKNGNFKVKSVKNDLNIYLTICDDEMSLGLFKNDNSFDQNRILISSNEKAIKWSKKLFNTIKNELR